MSERPTPGATFESLAAELLSALTNASLRLDPRSEARLRSLQGRCVHLMAELPAPLGDRTFTLLVRDARLNILPHAESTPNAVVRGSIPDLLDWFTRGGAGAGRISMDGDETVLQELTDIFRRYAPDLSEPMAGVLGTSAASNLVNLAEGAVATLRSALAGAGSAVQQGTADRFVTRTQLNAFLDVLDDARSRVDRLAERVRTCEARRAAGEGGEAAR